MPNAKLDNLPADHMRNRRLIADARGVSQPVDFFGVGLAPRRQAAGEWREAVEKWKRLGKGDIFAEHHEVVLVVMPELAAVGSDEQNRVESHTAAVGAEVHAIGA